MSNLSSSSLPPPSPSLSSPSPFLPPPSPSWKDPWGTIHQNHDDDDDDNGDVFTDNDIALMLGNGNANTMILPLDYDISIPLEPLTTTTTTTTIPSKTTTTTITTTVTSPPPPTTTTTTDKDSNKLQLSTLPRITPSLTIDELHHELEYRRKNHALVDPIERDDNNKEESTYTKEWYMNILGNGSIWETSSIAKNIYYLSRSAIITQEEVDSTIPIPTPTPTRRSKRKRTITQEEVDATIPIPTPTATRRSKRKKTITQEEVDATIPTPSRRRDSQLKQKGKNEKSSMKEEKKKKKKEEDEALVGKKVCRAFEISANKFKPFVGTVTGMKSTGTKRSRVLFSIVYEDGDAEDLYKNEVMDCIRMYEMEMEEEKGPKLG